MNTYIFDFDGTIADSMGFWNNLLFEYLDNNKIVYDKETLFTDISKLHKTNEIAQCLSENYITYKSGKEVEDDLRNRFMQFYSSEITLKKGSYELLEYLKDKGNKIYILSATDSIYLNEAVKYLKIDKFIDKVYSEKDFGMNKYEREIYYHVCKLENLEMSKCIFIDDNYKVVNTACDTEMTVFGVYDQHTSNNHRVVEICDCFFKDNIELLNYIKENNI